MTSIKRQNVNHLPVSTCPSGKRTK